MLKYKHTTRFTRATSSLMLVLNHFNSNFKVNKQNEFKLWLGSVALPTRSSCIYALGLIAHKRGIKTKVVVGHVDYKFPNYKFKDYDKKELYAAKFAYKMYYDEAIKRGVKIEVRDFDIEEIKDNLKKNKLILLLLNIGGLTESKPSANYILLNGYGNSLFLANDTHEGNTIQIREEKFKELFNDVQTKCKTDKKMIIFG